LYHADGQTDMTKLTDAFRSFANAPKEHILSEIKINFRTYHHKF